MKKTSLLNAVLILAAGSVFCAKASAATQLFQIGTFDNTQLEFEQESGAYNDPQYYYEAGNYSTIVAQSISGAAVNYAGGQEILLTTPLNDPELLGMPRALVPDRPVVDIFFQMDATEASSTSLEFTTTLMALGNNGSGEVGYVGSSHNLTFYLNGQAFHSDTYSTTLFADREKAFPVSVSIPFGSIPFNTGSNVLSVQRTGGSPNTPWIQFDALSLNAVPEPGSALLGLATLGLLAGRRRSARTSA